MTHICATCDHLAQMHDEPAPYACAEPNCTCKAYIARGPDLPDNHPEAEPPPVDKDVYPMVTLEQYRGIIQTSLNADYELALFEQDNMRLLEIAKLSKTDMKRAHKLYEEEFGEPNIMQLVMVMITLEKLGSQARQFQILMHNARTAFEVHNKPGDFTCESPEHIMEHSLSDPPPAITLIATTPLCREHAHAHGFWGPDEKPDDAPNLYEGLIEKLWGPEPTKSDPGVPTARDINFGEMYGTRVESDEIDTDELLGKD